MARGPLNMLVAALVIASMAAVAFAVRPAILYALNSSQ